MFRLKKIIDSYNIGVEFLAQDAIAAARKLIGYRIYAKEADGSLTGGMITETEAYTADDAASHSFKGETPRNAMMFGPAGRIYVYFTYGIHWCMNIVTGEVGSGQAVLIRSILPDKNLELIRTRRKVKNDAELTNGPAKICQALGITGADNGEKLGENRFVLYPPVGDFTVRPTKRIGIKKDTHRLWRFIIDD